MYKKNRKIISLILISITFSFIFQLNVKAANEKTLTVHYLDQYGIEIAPASTFSEEEATSITLNAYSSSFFTLYQPATPSINYTFTADEEQTYTFHYVNNRVNAPNSYFSMYFDTTYTYTGFVGYEYGGNLGYFNLVEDDTISAKYTTSFGVTNTQNKTLMFEVDFPTGHKFSLTNPLDICLFRNDSGNQVLPLEMLQDDYTEGKLDLTSEGVEVEYWVSIDNKQNYLPYSSLTAEEATKVTSVVGRIFFSNNLSLAGNRLFLVADIPISLNQDSLSQAEINGTTPISGWQYRTPEYTQTVLLDTNIYLLNPSISGTIKTHDSQDWDEAEPLANQKIELVELDASNNEKLLATTFTAVDGSYFFQTELKSFNNIRIKVIASDGSSTYFHYIDDITNDSSFLDTKQIDVGNLPQMVDNPTQNILSWFQPLNSNSLAQHSHELDFLVIKKIPENPGPETKPEVEKPSTTPSGTKSTSKNSAPATGDHSNIKAELILFLASLIAISYLWAQKNKSH